MSSVTHHQAVLLLTEFEGETLGHTIMNLLTEVERLRSGMQDILDDFETTKTDMWSIIKRIQELIE